MPRLTVTERAPLGSGSTRRAAPEPPATSRAGRPRASTTIRATVDRADATRRTASTPAQAAVRERALPDAVLHATRLHAAPSRTTKATVAPLTSTDRTLPASASVRVPAASGWQTYASADPASITTASGTAHTSRRTRTAAIALPLCSSLEAANLLSEPRAVKVGGTARRRGGSAARGGRAQR